MCCCRIELGKPPHFDFVDDSPPLLYFKKILETSENRDHGFKEQVFL